MNGDAEKKDNVPTESKSTKMKKKKDRVSKQAKEHEDQPNNSNASIGLKEVAINEQEAENDLLLM